MSLKGSVLFTTLLVLSAGAPFMYVSQANYGPKRATSSSEFMAAVLEAEASRGQLKSQLEADKSRRLESSRQLKQTRRDHIASVDALERSLAGAESARHKLAQSQTTAAGMEEQLRTAEERVAGQASDTEEVRAANAALENEASSMAELLGETNRNLTRTLQSTARLSEERRAWELDESISSVPRAALNGLVGWSENGLSAGAEFGIWMLRPWQQRLGFKAAYLVHEEQTTSYGYAGVAWQKLLPRRFHVDIWAGSHWSETTPESDFPVDPAAGFTFGVGVPRLHLGVGVTALLSPDDTLIGFSIGYSQIGESIDPYGRR